jgi:hypothetical protein
MREDNCIWPSRKKTTASAPDNQSEAELEEYNIRLGFWPPEQTVKRKDRKILSHSRHKHSLSLAMYVCMYAYMYVCM